MEEKNETGPGATLFPMTEEDWDIAVMHGQYAYDDERVDSVTFRRIDLASYLGQMRVEQFGKTSVLSGLLRDAKFPLMVSKADAMSAGEDGDVQMLRELLRRIDAALQATQRLNSPSSAALCASPT